MSSPAVPFNVDDDYLEGQVVTYGGIDYYAVVDAPAYTAPDELVFLSKLGAVGADHTTPTEVMLDWSKHGHVVTLHDGGVTNDSKVVSDVVYPGNDRSVFLDGNTVFGRGTDYLTTAPSPVLGVLGNGPFTIFIRFRSAYSPIQQQQLLCHVQTWPALAAYDIYIDETYTTHGVAALLDNYQPVQLFSGDNAILPETWHTVAVTSDGTTKRLFVDGVLQASSAVSININNTAAGLVIGAFQNSGVVGAQQFKGHIDVVAIVDGYGMWSATHDPSAVTYRDFLIARPLPGEDTSVWRRWYGHTVSRNMVDALLPPGPIWVPKPEGGFDGLVGGLSDCFEDARVDLGVLADLRNPWRTTYLNDLEAEFGLTYGGALADDVRRQRLAARMYLRDRHGTVDDMQEAIDLAGITGVYVYENDPALNPAPYLERVFYCVCGGQYGYCGNGQAFCGNTNAEPGWIGAELLVNGRLQETRRDILSVSGVPWMCCGNGQAVCGRYDDMITTDITYPVPHLPEDWPLLFWVTGPKILDGGGAFIGFSAAQVPAERRDELRTLILRHKPLDTWAILVIEYV